MIAPRGISLAFTKSLFLLRTAVLVLMLDAMVAIVFYFRKRRARFTSPTTSLPVRPALLSSTIVSEVATVAIPLALRVAAPLVRYGVFKYTVRRPSSSATEEQHHSHTMLTMIRRHPVTRMQRGWLQLLPMQVIAGPAINPVQVFRT
jgi:hypothetical protein